MLFMDNKDSVFCKCAFSIIYFKPNLMNCDLLELVNCFNLKSFSFFFFSFFILIILVFEIVYSLPCCYKHWRYISRNLSSQSAFTRWA